MKVAFIISSIIMVSFCLGAHYRPNQIGELNSKILFLRQSLHIRKLESQLAFTKLLFGIKLTFMESILDFYEKSSSIAEGESPSDPASKILDIIDFQGKMCTSIRAETSKLFNAKLHQNYEDSHFWKQTSSQLQRAQQNQILPNTEAIRLLNYFNRKEYRAKILQLTHELNKLVEEYLAINTMIEKLERGTRVIKDDWENLLDGKSHISYLGDLKNQLSTTIKQKKIDIESARHQFGQEQNRLTNQIRVAKEEAEILLQLSHN